MYRCLSVHVGEEGSTDPDTWTVECSLQQFFQDEMREVKCEKCEEGKTATQTMKIISRSVIIHAIPLHMLRYFDVSHPLILIAISRSPKVILLQFKRYYTTQESDAVPPLYHKKKVILAIDY